MRLFEPIKIAKMELKNRIAMVAMVASGMVDIDGRWHQRGIDYYEARARGGVGLIIAGNAPAARVVKGLPRLSELADAIHHHGAKIAHQISPSGVLGRNFPVPDPMKRPGAPSEVPCYWQPQILTRELTIDEIEESVESFGQTVANCRMAGIDAIEIHGYGGYAVDMFNSAIWNKRTDKYGGDLAGRLTFSMGLISAAKKYAGYDYPIIYKFSPVHYIEGGRELEEGIEMAQQLEKAGVAALNVAPGCYESMHKLYPSQYEPPGTLLDIVEVVKRAVKIPVISSGKLGDPALAERALQEGKLDIVGLGRPLLADPDWVNKVKAGRVHDIRPCIGCQEGCLARNYPGEFHPLPQGQMVKYISCAVNPQTGKERDYALMPARKGKSVLVIGSGPGGMEAARVAATRGHKVALWEKSPKLGGALIAASVPDFKKDLRSYMGWLITQLNNLGVTTELVKEATPELVEKVNPDMVIVATGAVPYVPEIPGVDGDNVSTVVQVMLGKKKVGETVIVAGGGEVGCEAAVYLAQKGKKVTIVEQMKQLLPEVAFVNNVAILNKMGLLELIKENSIRVLTSSQLLEVTKDGAIISTQGGQKHLRADTIVLALGFLPDTRLKDALTGRVRELRAIGDCVEPRKVLNAVWEGFHAARLI